MRPLSIRRGAWSSFGVSLAAGLLAAAATAPSARSESNSMIVVLDQAKLVKLPDRVASLVIGNPLIVDAAIQAGGTMVLTAKGYGATNVLALDNGGNVLMERTVTVRAPRDTVVVYRGTDRQTYSCAPDCEHQVMLGDSGPAFTATMGQTVTRNSQAEGVAR